MATPRRYASEWTEAAHRIAVDELVEVVGRDGAAHLIGVFLRELPKRAEAFREAGEERDAIFRQAHEMQAMAGSFGLDALAEAAGELERACRRRRLDAIPALSGRVLDRIGQATEVLEQTMTALEQTMTVPGGG